MDFETWLEYGLANLSSPMRTNSTSSRYDADAQGRPTPAAIAASIDNGAFLSIATVNHYDGRITLIYPLKMSIKKARYDAKSYGTQQILDQFKNSYDFDQIFKKIKINNVKHDEQGLKITIELPSQKEFQNATQKYPAGVLMKI